MQGITSNIGFAQVQIDSQLHSNSVTGTPAGDRMWAQIKKSDPDKADALSQQMSDSQSLIKQMEAMRRGMKQAPKAEAAERVARIKAEIQMLQTMGGDPKMVARRIAQLARELGQAAKSYSAAGGSDSSSQNTDASPSGTSATITDGTTNSVASSESAPTAEAAHFAMLATISDNNAKLDDYRQTRLAELQQSLSANAAHANEAVGDRNFRDEVRALVAKLKELSRKAVQQLKETGDSNNPDIAAANRSLNEAEKAAGQIGNPIVTATDGGGVSLFA